MSDSSHHTDEYYWSLLLNGDSNSLIELYTRFYHTLFFIGRKHVDSPDLVKDVIQQQFLYFWEKRATMTQPLNVRAYVIMSFLRRLNKDWVRARKNVQLDVAWSRLEEGNFERSGEETMIDREYDRSVRQNLLHVINGLPPRQRELIFLKFYEGLEYAEIVKRTGLSHRTVYNRIYEAIEKIKDRFADQRGRQDLERWLMLLFFLHFLLSR